MANIAIYREANKGQVSSFHHLINTQDIENQQLVNNPNKDKTNLLIYVENGEYQEYQFRRNGKNQEDINLLNQIEKELDTEARKDYFEKKTKEKLDNPDKKIRTVLQSKDLKKEFIIAIGGDCEIDESNFVENVKKTVDNIMDKKGLTRDNIIGIFIHRDEAKVHLHCQFNDYSKKFGTTATQLARPKITKDMTKKEKSDLIQLQRKEFGKFQDIVADGLEMQRGKKDSKAKHFSKAQHFEKKSQEVEQLEKAIRSLEAERNKAKKDMEEYQFQAHKQAQELIKLGKVSNDIKKEIERLEQAKIDAKTPAIPIHEKYLQRTLSAMMPDKKPDEIMKSFEENYNYQNPAGAKSYKVIKEEAQARFDKLHNLHDDIDLSLQRT